MLMKYLWLAGGLAFFLQFANAQNAGPAPAAAPNADAEASGFAGKVLETTNAAGYTYVLVETGGKKLWATTTQFDVKVGDNWAECEAWQ